LADVLRRYHEEHPLDPGMSLQALRAAAGAPAPPAAVVDAVLEGGTGGRGGKAKLEIVGSVARLAGWGPALDARTSDLRETLTRKYLIPLLEWADRRGITRRAGDARVLARLTAGKGGP